jgi:AcrR family transcriptional regulator
VAAAETSGTRRRGAVLEQAIYDAALAELIEHGPGGLSMERVADRARTGKSSVYRRWPCKEALMLDTVHYALPHVDDPPDTGSLRGDLLCMLSRMARVMREPAGQAVRTLIAEGQGQPALIKAVEEQVIRPRIDRILLALRRATEHHPTDHGDRLELIARVGPALLIHELLLTGEPASEDEIGQIIDHIILPALDPPAEAVCRDTRVP